MKITTLKGRRGAAAMLAMLFLVLFATLAVGFYAATDTAVQISANDVRVNRALLAADSGMDLVRYHLEHVTIPPETASNEVVDRLYEDLFLAMNESPNLGVQTLGQEGNVVRIPSSSAGSIALGSAGNMAFRATITDFAGEIVVKIDGIALPSLMTRSISMDYSRRQKASSIFNFAVASRGQIDMRKGMVTSVTGVDPTTVDLFSAEVTSPSIVMSGGTIGGDLFYVEGSGVNVTGGTVGGTNILANILANHVHETEAPEFPTIDTSIYRVYATNDYADGAKIQQNIRIPAGTNPQFNGGDTVQGIMYIESPNEVTFRGNFNLQGFIVFENKGDTTQNLLDFRGSISQQPLPASPVFDTLRASTGVSILAPSASLVMSGGSDSLMRGNVIIGSFGFDGSADIQIDRGTLMAYNEGPGAVTFDGKTVKFTATGASNIPTQGVIFSQYFVADPTSYQELLPQ